MVIRLPALSLVVLVGASGSGKSTFARKHFLPTEILSSDYCRGLVSDSENDQTATNAAFEVLHFIAAKRLAAGKLTVIDATNVQAPGREQLIQLARRYHVLAMAIVLNLPEAVCHERNATRPDRSFGPHVVRNQTRDLRRSLHGLQGEGFKHVFRLDSLDEVNSSVVERVPLWTDKRDQTGPFDIIGDLHGCADELEELLPKLGYIPTTMPTPDPVWGERSYAHPAGRRVIFLGDLVDRGPRSLDCLRIVRNMVESGMAFCVPGNHDVKLVKKLRGKDVRVSHGMAETLSEFTALPDDIRPLAERRMAEFLDSLVSHYLLDGGQLVVAHAGLREEYQNRSSRVVREFCLYGETTGELDEYGLPVRANWAADYRGRTTVVYGHTPTQEPEWLNRTICLDTGCVFGGKLTALRYPERELVSVAAKREYFVPARPLIAAKPKLSAQQEHDRQLDAEDVLGKRLITTRLRTGIMIREEQSTAALEVMSRFAADPRWLIYLPPTMSPSETSQEPGYLEHPREALNYFRDNGVTQVIAEEKHMGSRAVVVVCQAPEVARSRFGVESGEVGIITTRTGRRFYNDVELESQMLSRLQTALTASGFWETHKTGWACLDCELMPWSAKAISLLQNQYAATGVAGLTALSASTALLRPTVARLEEDERRMAEGVLAKTQDRRANVERFIDAYRRYCYPVHTLEDYKLAPFHLLATETGVHVDQPHIWHMTELAKFCEADPGILLKTDFRTVELGNIESEDAVVKWWLELTEHGGEGVVFKPADFIARGPKGLVQPAVKCRGREYLRIIYGPDYTTEENLTRLRKRGLQRKRHLAISEFALGVESLERFVRHEPLRRVHECVFAVLALESEPVDPRL